MKTRIIQTRYWNDEMIYESTWQSRFVFIYLLTSDAINMSGVFQLPDKKILIETGMKQDDLNIAKEELELHKKVVFKKGWVWVVNAFKNNKYTNTKSNIDVWNNELSRIPEEIMIYFNSSVYSSGDSTLIQIQNQIQKQNLEQKEMKKQIKEEEESW